MFANPRTSTTQCSQTTTMASRSARCFFFFRGIWSGRLSHGKSRRQNHSPSAHNWNCCHRIIRGMCFGDHVLPGFHYCCWCRSWGSQSGSDSSVASVPGGHSHFAAAVLYATSASDSASEFRCWPGRMPQRLWQALHRGRQKKSQKKRHECKGSLCPLTHSSWFVQIIEYILKYIETYHVLK